MVGRDMAGTDVIGTDMVLVQPWLVQIWCWYRRGTDVVLVQMWCWCRCDAGPDVVLVQMWYRCGAGTDVVGTDMVDTINILPPDCMMLLKLVIQCALVLSGFTDKNEEDLSPNTVR